jgi:hypothetical protein
MSGIGHFVPGEVYYGVVWLQAIVPNKVHYVVCRE